MLYTLNSALYTLHSTRCTLNITLYTSHLTLDTALHTSHSTHHTLHFMHYTLHHALHGPHSTLYPPTLYTAHFTLHNFHLTLTLHTVHCTLYAPHTTLYSPHSTLQTSHFHTLHLTLHFRPSQLCTFHTLHCTDYWPSFISMLGACAYLLSSSSFVHCVASSRASKGPLGCRRRTFESSPITCHYVGYAEFLHPLRATVHTHMFSSSPPPTYTASVRRFGCLPYQHTPASDPLVHIDKKAAQLRCALRVSCHALCQASFRPLPLGLSLE